MKLSVIIPVYNGEKTIGATLDCLINQTVEDFEVIMINDGSTDSTAEICSKYCDEYVACYMYEQVHSGVYAARNTGIEKAKGEYLLFLDSGDALTPESVERIIEKSEADSPDIIIGRRWQFGDIEHTFDRHDDTLVVMPSVDKLESSLLWSGDLGNKAIKKKIIDLYNVRFFDLSAYGEYLFVMQCVYEATKISGCTEFVFEKRSEHLENGYSRFEMPTDKNLKSAIYVVNELYDMAYDMIMKETGNVDGDEAYLQSVMYFSYSLFLDNFYRRYWFMNDETLSQMRDEFQEMSKRIKKEKFEKLMQNNPDLRLPYIYVNQEEAVAEAMFSFMVDVADEELSVLMKSMYLQNYPFFEILIRKSDFDSEYFPGELRKMANITVFDDKDFFRAARAKASGKCILTLRGKDPVDHRVLSELAVSKVPKSFIQYAFASKRKQLQTRKYLKDKGMDIKDRDR